MGFLLGGCWFLWNYFRVNGSVYPMIQSVPSLTTGTLLAPPPAAMLANVVAVASVTKARAPAPALAAEGSVATV
jgi:hypothetical protein